jgi:Rps23 Pro-64 3,4-dihydroxylase Tpa1-like proline 4-hydroxylase
MSKNKFIRDLDKDLKCYGQDGPFDHVVLNDFFHDDIARALSDEFPSYDSKIWFHYNNEIENKKTSNNWNHFTDLTYQVFSYLNSEEFISGLSEHLGIRLKPDIGLHGGGWHIHANGGNLNPHRDYSIHPKLGLQRKLNLIVYLSPELLPGMGGELGLWSHNKEDCSPDELITTIQPIFNRAILFDTTQNSWHGLVSQLTCPDNVFRRSIAVYYLCEPSDGAETNCRAVFSPRNAQKNDQEVLALIERRQKL